MSFKRQKRTQLLFNVSLYFNSKCISYIFRISNYGTASTDSAAYILGGYYYLDGNHRTSTIAQFQNNEWLKIGNLKEVKSDPSAIFYDGEYLIIGGDAQYATGRLVN